ncbi:dTDP-4-dehydrorhamnose 3,5-epimerase, partial [Clostridium perfringens]
TFGQWEGVHLSAENKRQFYVPEGFAHGFVVLSDEAVFNYKCTDFYAPEYDSGLLWNDKDVNVEWPLEGIEEIILSEKDKKQKTLKELDIPFVYEG